MEGNKKVVAYTPPWYMSYGEAWKIVKLQLNDETVPIPRKVRAIEIVARMATLNSITKNELQTALRWLFDHYDFEEG